MKQPPKKLIIEDFQRFGGKHCITTSLKNLFEYHNLHLSEEMIFGLSGGVAFIYWYMKFMPAPFVGGRYGKIEDMVETVNRIGGNANFFQTSSSQKGYQGLKEQLEKGEPTLVFVDMPYLSYLDLPDSAHFGGHSVVVYGIDEAKNLVYISDRGTKGFTATIEELEKARNSKFQPFSPKNKLLKIQYPQKIDQQKLKEGIKTSIKNSCNIMLHPPITNFGLRGMQKWADLVLKWPKQFKDSDLFSCLFNVFIYIEVGGTGGSFFRNMYAKFLEESADILKIPELKEVAKLFKNSAKLWSEIAKTALSDSWPALKNVRELMVKKNRIFEEQKPNAMSEMKKISRLLNNDIKRATKEVQDKKSDTTTILNNLHKKILECREVEKQAFERLNEAINSKN